MATAILRPRTLDAEMTFAQAIHDQLGDALKDIEVFSAQILVGKFIRTTVGSSGRIIAAAQTQTEDKWQSKVGLVLKVGPLAFVDDQNHDFRGQRVEPGDWVLYRTGDGWDMDITPIGSTVKVPCRVLADVDVKGKVTRPDLVW